MSDESSTPIPLYYTIDGDVDVLFDAPPSVELYPLTSGNDAFPGAGSGRGVLRIDEVPTRIEIRVKQRVSAAEKKHGETLAFSLIEHMQANERLGAENESLAECLIDALAVHDRIFHQNGGGCSRCYI